MPEEPENKEFRYPSEERREEIMREVLAGRLQKRERAAERAARAQSGETKGGTSESKIVPFPRRHWPLAAGIAAALLCGFFLFLQFRPAAFKEFAMVTGRAATNTPAEAEKLRSLLHPLPVVLGDTNTPQRAILILLPDFQKLTVRLKLPDDSELSGSITPLPPPSADKETWRFRLAAKGTAKTGEAIEIEGDIEVRLTKPANSAGELRWKNVTSALVTLRKPAVAEFNLSGSGVR